MNIDLQIAADPDEMESASCGICEETYHPGSVLAHSDLGTLCPLCVEALSPRNPEFPTAEELERAKRNFPDPIFPSGEEADRTERKRDGVYQQMMESRHLVRVER